MIYFITNQLFKWITDFCEEPVNLARIEQEFEGCEYIPASTFEDLVSKPTLNRMLNEISTKYFKNAN